MKVIFDYHAVLEESEVKSEKWLGLHETNFRTTNYLEPNKVVIFSTLYLLFRIILSTDLSALQILRKRLLWELNKIMVFRNVPGKMLNPAFPCNVNSSGRSREGTSGGPAPHLPLFLDEIEAQRAKQYFLETAPHPPYLRVWMNAPRPPPPPSYWSSVVQKYSYLGWKPLKSCCTWQKFATLLSSCTNLQNKTVPLDHRAVNVSL